MKVKTDWDDRDFTAVMTDRYATFKNPADQLLQLVVYKTSQSQTFAYDKNGNRTELNMDGRASGLTYYKNASGGNLSLVAFDGTWYYKYDANGNLVLKAKALLADDTYNPGTGIWNTTCDTSQEYWSYDWDLLNRMTTAKHYLSGTTPTSTTSYGYDTSGLRVERTGSDGVTRYIYSTAGVLLQSQKTNGDRRTLAYLGSTILGWADSTTGSAGVVSTRYYAATDQLGSVTAVMDVHGAILWNSEYTPFGQVAGVRGSFDFTGIYTGKDIDTDTGLYYYNARWYDSSLGRFLSEDPAGQGTNWYTFVGNNPMFSIDQNGMWGFNLGFLIDFSWDSSSGFGIGIGFGCQVGSIGFTAAEDYNQNGSWTTTLDASVQFDVGAFGVNIGGGASYNSKSGWSGFANVGANALGFGFDVGVGWSATGGNAYADAWVGSQAAHVGVGVSVGWGDQQAMTGGYVLLGTLGVTTRGYTNGEASVNGSAGFGVGGDTDKPNRGYGYVNAFGQQWTWDIPAPQQVAQRSNSDRYDGPWNYAGQTVSGGWDGGGPGWDPAKSPGDKWVWRGRGQIGDGDTGGWYNPGTGESLHPDLNHPEGIEPHWDYIPGKGESPVRINPDTGEPIGPNSRNMTPLVPDTIPGQPRGVPLVPNIPSLPNIPITPDMPFVPELIPIFL